MDGSEDINEDNNSLTAELRLNIPPEAHIQTKEWIYSGDVLLWMEVFQKTATEELCHTNGSGKWSGKEGAHITHTYQIRESIT